MAVDVAAQMDVPKRFDESTFQEPTWLGKVADKMPARGILYVLSFSGFLVSFMMRTDINITIVAMVNIREERNDTMPDDERCYDPANTTILTKDVSEPGEFDWSRRVQSIVIGSFFWCYILSQVVGGVLTQRLGPKTVFGVSQLATALCSLLMPTAARAHYAFVIALRSIQGVASGLTWPAMYAMVGPWIPPHERSRFMSSFQGFSFGIGLTYVICGFIIANYGWQFVFYTTGSVGLVWCVAWYLLAYDTPASHPRISQQELRLIQGSLCNQVVVTGTEGARVPWKAIITSWQTWAIGITTFGRIWVHYIFIVSGPMYMKTVLGFNIQANGVLSGVPHILSYLSSVVFCFIAEVLERRQMMSLTNVRKLFTALSQIVPGILVLVIGYLGCNKILVLAVWFVAVTLITAAYAGAMANIVDIAPNYAGPVLAFAQTIHMTASFLSPLATGFLTNDNLSLSAWRNVFALAACIACATYVIYQICGTAEVQPWNYPQQKYPLAARDDDDDSEPLSNKTKSKTNNTNKNKTGIIVPRQV